MAKKHILFKPYRPGDEHRLHWYDKRLVNLFSRSLYFWEKYFRYETVGLENIPRRKGALIANNHGLLPFDVVLLARRLIEMGRPPRALADHATWTLPILREVLLNMGIVDGNPRNAMRLLRAGEIVVVFPGGAREGMKSSAERYRLFWEDRVGFVKVAIAAGVPILPAFSAGIDHCYWVFANSYELGKKYLGRYVPLPLCAGLGVMPFPVKIRHYVGKPIDPGSDRLAYRDARAVKRLHGKVLREMEKLKARALDEYRPLGG